MVEPYFGMLWSEDIPTVTPAPGVSVDVIAGSLGGSAPPSPPPDSWGSDHSGHLGIWLIRLDAGATWELPATASGVNRMLHCFIGDDVVIDGVPIEAKVGARLDPTRSVRLVNRGGPAEFLLLEGTPIGAPVFQMGPFVMNTPEELRQAVDDYHRTRFGGWPWSRSDPVHDRSEGRFAIHADGHIEHRDRHKVS
jgi:quercetin 2,3-dioxygenase